MKNLEFQELSMQELEEVNGGSFLVACCIIAVGALLTGCTVVVGDNNNVGTSVSADSTANGNVNGHGSGNSIR